MDLKTLITTIKAASHSAGFKVSGSSAATNAMTKSGKLLLTSNNINKINSLQGKARNSIAQFPVLVSENLDPKLVPILTNTIEIEQASLLMLVISSESSFTSGNAASVLKKFHNIDGGVLTDSTFLEGVDSVHEIYRANKDLLQPYEECFNMKTLNESYYTGSLMDYLTEGKAENAKNLREKEKHDMAKDAEKRAKDIHDWKKADREREAEERRREREEREAELKRDAERHDWAGADQRRKAVNGALSNTKTAVDTLGSAVNTAISVSREMDRRKDREMDRKRYADDQAQRNYMAGKATVQTSMRDIVKFNDMHPLIFNVEVNFLEPKSKSVVTRNLSLGVKCVSHLVKGDDIEYYLTKAFYKNSRFLRTIKWTTGEIKFWKDLVLTLDDIKLSALQNSKTVANKNHFSNLEYIAKSARSSALAGTKTENIPTAITTLIITKTDVENIRYRDGVNILSNPNYLKKIVDTYYLSKLLIVDESLDIVYRYDQFSNTIERVPFSSYEKNSKERVVNANDLLKLAR